MIYKIEKPRKHYNIDPCPFCGAPGILEGNQRAFIDGKTVRVALVRCSKCGARGGRYKLTSYNDEGEQAAVDHWNMRRENNNE